MQTTEKTRQQVADFYAAQIADKDCCWSPKLRGSQLVTYDEEALGVAPKELTETSFGCGNPLAFAAVQPGQTVLDLGSGAGLDLVLAAERVGPTGHVMGVDMTDDMLALAQRNIARSGFTNIDVRKGIIEALPVDSNTVDWVISNCVINLSPEKERVFSEMHRVLKPGGRFSLSDIVVQDLPWWVHWSRFMYAACVSGAISETQYLDGLKNAGFTGATVTERQFYEPSQLVGLIEEMMPGVLTQWRWGSKPLIRTLTQRIANRMTRRVWSAKFVGEKAA